jgi:hypothetical protein
MPIEFDVQITEKLLRSVALRFILRQWPLKLLAVVLLGIGLVFDYRSGSWSALSIVSMTALGLLMLIYLAYSIRQRRAIAEWKRKQGDVPVHYRLTEETIHVRSNLGAAELKWAVFRELIECHDCLLLCFSSSNQFTLPRTDLPAEALDFIRLKFKELKLPVKRE